MNQTSVSQSASNWTAEEPMKSLKGASMRLNIDSGMAEVIHEDRVTSFGGVPAIKEWVQELGISKDDARRLYELDAQGSRRSELSAEAEEALAGMRKNIEPEWMFSPGSGDGWNCFTVDGRGFAITPVAGGEAWDWSASRAWWNGVGTGQAEVREDAIRGAVQCLVDAGVSLDGLPQRDNPVEVSEKRTRFPVLFQIDPETKEATGTVMPFCSESCREACSEHGLGETVAGMADEKDFGYEVHCEQCGEPVLAVAAPGHTAKDLLRSALTYIEFPERVDVDWLAASLKSELADDSAREAKEPLRAAKEVPVTAGNYAAFNANTALGKFTAIVKLEEGMSRRDARSDAISLVKACIGEGAVSVSEDFRSLAELPQEAWEDKKAAGWGWMAKGYLADNESVNDSARAHATTGHERYAVDLNDLARRYAEEKRPRSRTEVEGVSIVSGQQIGGGSKWYRNDLILRGEQPIGFVQVSNNRDRVSSLSFCGEDVVIGRDVPWIVRRAEELARPMEFVRVTLENTLTAAFADIGRDSEIKRILLEAADRVKVNGLGDGFRLHDANGNAVGRLEVMKDVPSEPIEVASGANGRVRVDIDLLRYGFQTDPKEHIAACLAAAASKVPEAGAEGGFLLNGPDGDVLGAMCVNKLPEGALEAERRLGDLGLPIISTAEIEQWNQEKNAHAMFERDVVLQGWQEQDGFLTKEFYVRDPDGEQFGIYRKAWFGDYAGGDSKEIFVTDANGKELELQITNRAPDGCDPD